MTREKPEVQVVRRAGGVCEAAGFIMIVGGMSGCMAREFVGDLPAAIGGIAVALGFVTFLVGRFM